MAVVAATGFFDGVHRGHRAVLRQINRMAAQMGSESAIVTFWPHPRIILNQDSNNLRLLNTLSEKKALIESCGIDHVYVIPFTSEIGAMTARDFILDYLVGKFNVDTLIIGYDHRLGSDNLSGDGLAAVVSSCGLNVSIVNEMEVECSHVSSTVIRGMIERGDFRNASLLLGYDWTVTLKDFKSGQKVLPLSGLYRVRVMDMGNQEEFVLEVGNYDISQVGMLRSLSSDAVITFLEKIS